MSEISSDQPIELRSHEVQEIISQVPSGIVRWGMTVLLATMILLVLIAWFIQYPDVLRARVVVTTARPPVTLVSRTTGNLVLLKSEGDAVLKGELIGYLRTSASPEAVLDLEKDLKDPDESAFLSQNSLGELEGDYGTLVNASQELRLFYQTALHETQIRQLYKQEITYRKLQQKLESQKSLAEQELALAIEKFNRDSLLYSQKVNTQVDFNRDRATWLQQQRAFNNAETALVGNEVQLNLLSKQISDLEIQKKVQQQLLETAVTIAKKALLANILKWKESFLFVAPSDGQIAFIGFKENEMFIDNGKPLFSIMPANDILIARAELPLYNSGKVKEGQRVNIRLDNYPFEQYGAIAGIVSSISSIPKDERYFVTIQLPYELRTTQNKTLIFKQQLSGTTEIITEELRLLERFFYQFRKLVSASN